MTEFKRTPCPYDNPKEKAVWEMAQTTLLNDMALSPADGETCPDEARVKEILGRTIRIVTDQGNSMRGNMWMDDREEIAKAICACHVKEQDCPECKGSGTVLMRLPDDVGSPNLTTCPACHGSGKDEGEVKTRIGKRLAFFSEVVDNGLVGGYRNEEETWKYLDKGAIQHYLGRADQILAIKGGRK